jgi:hypothetical protein
MSFESIIRNSKDKFHIYKSSICKEFLYNRLINNNNNIYICLHPPESDRGGQIYNLLIYSTRHRPFASIMIGDKIVLDSGTYL